MDGRMVTSSRLREAVAKRMTESKREVPHFYVEAQIEVSPALALARQLNAEGTQRVSFTSLLVRACAVALRGHPRVNAVWTEDGLLEASPINISVAVALDDGVLAPAILDADTLDVVDLAAALDHLVERAREGRLRMPELSEGTFTLSNLGMFGVTRFGAIVTPPQVAVLATGRPVEQVVLEDGQPVAKRFMSATLSADHRALDGADAARFLDTLRVCLEDPAILSVAHERAGAI